MATLHADWARFRANLDRTVDFCSVHDLSFLPVTKVIQSRPDLLAAVDHPALAQVADVPAPNLGRLDPQRHPVRVCLRPRFSDAEPVARAATRVLVSDPSLGLTLGQARAASHPGQPLGVWVMVEAGDLRDGIPWDDLPGVVRTLASDPGLEVLGLAANYGCLAGALPNAAALGRLAEGLGRVRRATGLPLPGFSLGGTVCWEVLDRSGCPPEITELRAGEAAFFGWNTSLGAPVPGLDQGVFRLELEVLEVWTKDVWPRPAGGLNAFGAVPTPAPTGHRIRAVLDGGETLAPVRALTALDPGVILVGETHEYTVVDVTDAAVRPRPGETLSFRPGYDAVARAFLSPSLTLSQGAVP